MSKTMLALDLAMAKQADMHESRGFGRKRLEESNWWHAHVAATSLEGDQYICIYM